MKHTTFSGFDKWQERYTAYFNLMRTLLPQIAEADLQKIYADVEKEIVADWQRSAQKQISRKKVILFGNADRLDATKPAAQIYLIDGATREGLAPLHPVNIQGIQFRKYIPEKPADRTVKSHILQVTKHLVSSNNWVSGEPQNLDLTCAMLQTPFDTEGMTINCPPYASDICLTYANMDTWGYKTVFMLRPQRYLSALTYRLYCGAVLYCVFGYTCLTNTQIQDKAAKQAIISDLVLSKQKPWGRNICKTVTPIQKVSWETFT